MFFITKCSLFIFLIGSLSRTLLCEKSTLDVSKQIMRLAKSAEIQAMLNTQVDPCDDFYKYACGRWHRHNPAQLMTNIITDRFQLLAHTYERRLNNFLNYSQNTTSDTLENKIRNFYVSCQMIDVDHVSYLLHLENVYKEYTNFPAFANSNSTENAAFNWWHVIANIQQKYGKQIIIAMDLMNNIKNKKHKSIYLGPPIHTRGSNSRIIQHLQEPRVSSDIVRLFGVEQSLAENIAREMVNFEQNIMQSGTNAELGMELEDMLSLVKVDDLNETALYGFNVRKFLELIIGDVELVPDDIYIFDMKYLNNTLKIISETPRSTVANYILWQLLQQYVVDDLDENEEKVCQKITTNFFGKYLDYALYQSYKTKEVEQDVYNVWEEIRETYRDDLRGDKLDWISNKTREYALEKLNFMKLQINSYEDVNFMDIYANLNINRLGFVENVRQLLMLESQHKMKLLKEMSTNTKSIENSVIPYTISYNFFDNTIYIPVSLLQPHFFWDKYYPQAIKYATLGYMIAHEIIHGFDDQGRHYDKEGNEFSWWDEKSTYEFEARRKCFRAQYQNFKFEGQHLPPSISLSENIADNAGIHLAYKTYERWLTKQSIDLPNIERIETLPGLTFDKHQLFFISFAQLWCSDVQILFKFSLAAADTHSPSMYRIIGSLQNFQEFSWVFKCNPEARMDPKYKCYLY